MANDASAAARAGSPMAVVDREWHRFTPAQRFGRYLLYFGMVLALVASLRTVQIIPEFLYDAPEQVMDLLSRMWPVAWAYYPKGVHEALVETLHIATLGTILAVIMAIPLAFLAAANITPFPWLNYAAKLLLVSSRSVNTLVWALLFVAIFGPGALAGVWAVAFRSIGFVGKLLGEALEEARPGPVEALKSVGAPWPTQVLKGYWPQVEPAFWAIVLLRWDIGVRESSVLGLVGAGGIGMAMDSAMNLFQWDRVALMMVAIFVIVIVAEIVVTAIRKRII
jgi:phosphonate transport system permease protein